MSLRSSAVKQANADACYRWPALVATTRHQLLHPGRGASSPASWAREPALPRRSKTANPSPPPTSLFSILPFLQRLLIGGLSTGLLLLAAAAAGRVVPTWNILDRSVSVSAGSRPATQVQASRPTPKAATRTREIGQATFGDGVIPSRSRAVSTLTTTHTHTNYDTRVPMLSHARATFD